MDGNGAFPPTDGSAPERPVDGDPRGEARLRAAGERISTLLDALGAGGAVARERAEDLVRQVTDLYGAGLERILTVLTAGGPGRDDVLNELLADDLVSCLLLVHGLHPRDLATRVASALDSVRPYLGSHGGDVELLGISDDGAVRLRLLGSCQGCPSSSVTLKYAVEDAIMAAAPEATSIVVQEAEKSAGSPALIPVSSLRLRLDQVPEQPEGSWEALPGIAELQPGEVAGFLAAGVELLVCRSGQDLYAFRDYCPRCTGSMAGAALQRALAAPTGGGLLRCPLCRSHFDVRRAGACVEDKGLHLDPLPLLVRSGVMSVAVPVGTERA
jgi:Fe-S cluster biogenesis protein NfuA/nitrite reductase/ring-hydroxylating ferredoxin subunit